MDRHNDQQQFAIGWSRLQRRLVYLPGAIIVACGLWLSLTVGTL
jgi:hypothetical protein